MFELAIFPPRRLDEGFGSDSGFSPESKELICRMDIGTGDGNSMFESAAAVAIDEERRREDEVVGLYSAFLPCCLLSDQNSVPTSS